MSKPLLQSSTISIFSTTTVQNVYGECGLFYYNRLALILWITASTSCFLALISTIYTVFNAYQLWSTVQDLENAIIDLMDEACQILLPIGVCKQIGHPHHIGTVNANYGGKGQKQDVKLGTKDNRYPEDVTFPPSDIEKVYDVMGDEDARKSKTMTLVSLDDGSLDDKPPPKSEKPPPRTPNVPNTKQPSREMVLLTPKPSLKTANEPTRKTQSMEQLAALQQAKRSASKEQMSGGGGSGPKGIRPSREANGGGTGGAGEERRLPSRESNGPGQFSGGERKTPSRERESSKKTNAPPKMTTAEPL